MSISPKVEQYLKQSKVKFEIVGHRKVFTAYDLAATLREQLDSIVKTLLVKADTRLVLVVMPASRRLDIPKLKKFLGAKTVLIASERDMVSKLKIKPGAITGFGTIHKVEVAADKTLGKITHALIGAGSFTDSVRMKMREYLKLENAKLGAFTTSANLKLPKPAKKPAKKKSASKKLRKRVNSNKAKKAKLRSRHRRSK